MAFLLALGILFSKFGTGELLQARAQEAADPPAITPLPVPQNSSNPCSTSLVSFTLNSEQIGFCAPTRLASVAVEDSLTSPEVAYAQFNQTQGYGLIDIKSVAFGNSPGIGRPVYREGEIAAYRQEVWNIESSKNGYTVSNGPAGYFWGEPTPSMQVDTTLATSQGTISVRSTEWYLEHNDRLWAVLMTWDTKLDNANEWISASQGFSIQQPETNTPDTAQDLGRAYFKSQASPQVSAAGVPVDVGTAPWWSGTCDDNNYYPYTGVHSVPLDSAWHGVPSCGPRPYTVSSPDHLAAFFSGAFQEYEFECVELVMRFLYQEWGIAPWAGNANQIKNNYPAGSMVFYANGTHSIVPGDILTENGSSQNPYGHTAVITAVDLDGNGTGTISILEQNSSPTGSRSLSVTNWTVSPDAYIYGQTIQGWLHALANQSGGNPPSAFGKSTPANGAKAQSSSPTLSWAASTGATGYEYCYDTIDNDSCDTSWISAAGTTASVSGLDANTIYYWQVRADNSAGSTYANGNAWWSFNTRLAAPTLLAPASGGSLLNLRPALSWNAVNGAGNYTLQISKYGSFSSLQLNVTAGATSYTVSADYPAVTTFYWRVRTNGSNGPSLWSDAASFTTANPPSIPILSLPANKSLTTNYSPTLQWRPVTTPPGTAFDHYRVQLATDVSFNSPLIDDSSLADIGASRFVPASSLAPNSTYYWRVSAYNSNGEYSSWSAVRSFRTSFLPPTPLTPADNSTSSVQTNRPTLTWSDPNASGVTGYAVQFSRSSTFAPLVMTGSSTTSSFTPPANLPANTVLYWRIQTKGVNGPSLWSSPAWAFLTGNPPSVPVPLSPANNSLVTNYSDPTFSWKASTAPAGTFLDHYQIQVANNTAFSLPIIDAATPASSYPSTVTLDPNTKYYWHVRAYNTNNDFSGWSATWSLRASLLPPTLNSPTGTIPNSSPRPTFGWTDPNTSGVSGYTIQISNSMTFTSSLVTANPKTTSYTATANLPPGIPLYWRVRVKGTNGPSAWSAPDSFTDQ
ncbi:MAG TPA: CHAP domain-containing protein [Anaerolineales bacterium]|nr:CHAP domain-containing protein [Anaerolineales bacterium]